MTNKSYEEISEILAESAATAYEQGDDQLGDILLLAALQEEKQ